MKQFQGENRAECPARCQPGVQRSETPETGSGNPFNNPNGVASRSTDLGPPLQGWGTCRDRYPGLRCATSWADLEPPLCGCVRCSILGFRNVPPQVCTLTLPSPIGTQNRNTGMAHVCPVPSEPDREHRRNLLTSGFYREDNSSQPHLFQNGSGCIECAELGRSE